MRLRREANLGIGTMLVLQILLSVLTIALLNRMGPAVEIILEDNVFSGEAVEEMLAALTEEDGKFNFSAALIRAKENVTEEAERPILDQIEANEEAALAGDPEARRLVVAALRKLGQVNRDSMIKADEKAKRLSQAGAWGAALLGALALALAIAVYRRLRLRLELPIDHLHTITEQIRQGNMQARCKIMEGPVEVQRIGMDLNWLLDNMVLRLNPASVKDPVERETQIRRTLAWLLDQETRPAVVVDDEGVKVAANQPALHLELPADESQCEVHPIEGTNLRLIRFDA